MDCRQGALPFPASRFLGLSCECLAIEPKRSAESVQRRDREKGSAQLSYYARVPYREGVRSLAGMFPDVRRMVDGN